MTTSRIALVTGATQGLGRALVEGLAARLRPGDHVYLTGRDGSRIASGVATIVGAARVHGLTLDVTDTASVEKAAAEIGAAHGGIDIVISNAGSRMSPDSRPADEVDEVVESYNLGAIRMLRSFLPILRPGGRFLVVASSFGRLGHLDPKVRPLLDDPTTLEDIEAVLAGWRAAVHDGTATSAGWPEWLNVPSKVAQVAAVRVEAARRRERDLAEGTLLASVCPGLIDTGASRPWFVDMSNAQTPAQAAVAVLDLALSSTVDGTHYGELIRFGEVLSWRDEITPDSTAEVRGSTR
jgi:NAD(P)-dependent dehydrogenase (short-subunit alcohol dehydrogenase family)